MVKVLSPITSDEIPDSIQAILSARTSAKAKKDFNLADKLRLDAEKLGYVINDKAANIQEVLKIGDGSLKPLKNFLVLFGSGEIAPSSVDIYRQIFLSLGKRDLRIALITTPAGFQPNVEKVYGEIKDFLLASLPDFNLTIDLIFANNHALACDTSIVESLNGADILFLGPGSPSYAVHHLKDSPLMNKIIEQVKKGSTLILASAATISFSTHALPVYEIYKVGEELHWLEGLAVYKELWKDVSVIPHFNNREGGVDLDTSYCFVGKNRATKLLQMLPGAANFLGIDEHTALVIDLSNNSEQIRGKGTVTKVQ